MHSRDERIVFDLGQSYVRAHHRFYNRHWLHCNARYNRYRIAVTEVSGSGSPAWDSGVVNVANVLPAQIDCGKPLTPMYSYTWTAQWWSGQQASAVSAPAVFEVGPLSESDWVGSRWVGGGQNEFRVNYTLPSGVAMARLYVSPCSFYHLHY